MVRSQNTYIKTLTKIKKKIKAVYTSRDIKMNFKFKSLLFRSTLKIYVKMYYNILLVIHLLILYKLFFSS